MTDCIICSGSPPRAAVKRVTWVTGFPGSEKGEVLQGGPMCEPCMTATCTQLSRFPRAYETLTIWPLFDAALDITSGERGNI